MTLLDQPWLFILNPSAGNGQAGQQWEAMLPTLSAKLPQLEWRTTNGAGDAIEIARKAVEAGARHLVAVGGDGTHHEVVNGIVAALGPQRSAEVTYGLIPLGSGNDWIKTHGIPRKIEEWIAMLEAGHTRTQNLGRIYYRVEGKPRQRVFANVAGLAYDAYVVQRAEHSRFKSRLLYPLLTLFYLKDYVPITTRLVYDDQPEVVDQFYTINIGIGKYSGGGMQLVPQADSGGLRFALTYAKKLSVFKIILNSWRFYTGTIGGVKEVTTTQARGVFIESWNPHKQVAIEADGEWLGYGPVEIALLPQALRFVAPAESD